MQCTNGSCGIQTLYNLLQAEASQLYTVQCGTGKGERGMCQHSAPHKLTTNQKTALNFWTFNFRMIKHIHASWWFQPFWKISVKLDTFPQIGDENKTSLKPELPRRFRSSNHPTVGKSLKSCIAWPGETQGRWISTPVGHRNCLVQVPFTAEIWSGSLPKN